MLLALNGATTMKADLLTDIEVAAQTRYDYLEIWAEKLEKYLQTHSLGQLKAIFGQNGVKPLSINALENITFQSVERFEQIKEACTLLCERAKALECEFLVTVPSPLPDPNITRGQSRKESVEKLQALLGIAKNYGIGLAYEFLGEPNCSVKDLALCNEIVEEIDDPDLGMVLDVFHFYSGGSTLEMIDQVDPKKLFVVHLNDSEDLPKDLLRDDHRLLPGEGVIPLHDILARVKKIGYQGPYSIELFRPEYWEWDPSRLAMESRKKMLAILNLS